VVAGHVDAGEIVTQAAIREANEEVWVVLEPADLQIVHVMNRKSKNEQVDFFIAVRHWGDEVINNEPNKCDEVSWVPIDSLGIFSQQHTCSDGVPATQSLLW
jgi:8-oxo-dGTP diphosphatase